MMHVPSIYPHNLQNMIISIKLNHMFSNQMYECKRKIEILSNTRQRASYLDPKGIRALFEIMIQNSSHKGVGVSTWHTFNNGEPILLCYDFMGLFHTYIILKRGKFER